MNVGEHPDAPIERQALVTRMAAELQLAKRAGNQRQIYVKGDRHVSYEKVVQAMVLLQQAGAASVGLLTHHQE